MSPFVLIFLVCAAATVSAIDGVAVAAPLAVGGLNAGYLGGYGTGLGYRGGALGLGGINAAYPYSPYLGHSSALLAGNPLLAQQAGLLAGNLYYAQHGLLAGNGVIPNVRGYVQG